jgi:hypothetical protein
VVIGYVRAYYFPVTELWGWEQELSGEVLRWFAVVRLFIIRVILGSGGAGDGVDFSAKTSPLMPESKAFHEKQSRSRGPSLRPVKLSDLK